MTLTNYSVLIEAALEDRYIDEQELTLLKEWKKILKIGRFKRA